MGRVRDLTGQRFGRLVALSCQRRNGPRGGRVKVFWICKCDCGNETRVESSNLNNGHIKSCGCLHSEVATKTNTTHGLSKTRFYQTWRDMIVRTTSKKCIAFDRYGGNGIAADERWRIFENFMEDMYESYLEHARAHGEKRTTIERVDNKKGYSPGNCKWATPSEQGLNRKSNTRYLVNGELITKKEIADKYGLSYSAINNRIRRNWPTERLLEPMRRVNHGA